MARIRTHGRPDLFVTVTCNPNWPEIRCALRKGMSAKDRDDVIARVFKMKLDEILADLQTCFGETLCLFGTIEYQKRGLPHAHILMCLVDKIADTDLDKFLCAELPCRETQPLLHTKVWQHHMHARCDRAAACHCHPAGMPCEKRFPKDFREASTFPGKGGHALLRRREPGHTCDDGHRCQTRPNKGGVEMDNRWVVAHNPTC
jgi:ATP-dependent DNA helicase PIF1